MAVEKQMPCPSSPYAMVTSMPPSISFLAARSHWRILHTTSSQRRQRASPWMEAASSPRDWGVKLRKRQRGHETSEQAHQTLARWTHGVVREDHKAASLIQTAWRDCISNPSKSKQALTRVFSNVVRVVGHQTLFMVMV